MSHILTREELNKAVLYRLECIAGFSANIQKAMEHGFDLSDRFNDIEKVDRLFADLSDEAENFIGISHDNEIN